MKTPFQSEFEKILREKLGSAEPQGREPGGPRPAEDNDPLSGIFFEWLGVRGAGAQAKVRFKFGGAAARAQGLAPESGKRAEPTPETMAAPKPEPRVKREWSRDQLRALKTLVNFGEKDLGECSTDSEIKIAYKRLARKYHPDIAGANPNNEEFFKIISAAYRKLIP